MTIRQVLIPLTNNIALLLAMALVFDTVARRHRENSRFTLQILTGLAVAVTAIAVMANPLRFTDGVIFDTRSILLCISGLFFGTIPTVIGMTAAAVFRVYEGGGGTFAGVSLILTAGAIGLIWRHLRKGRLDRISGYELYFLGLVVHIGMVLWMFALPRETVREVQSRIAPIVLGLYPPGTVLLGILMANRISRIRTQEELEESEENLRITLRSIGDAVISVNLQQRVHRMNPIAEELTGYSSAEAAGRPLSEIFNIVNAQTRKPAEDPVGRVLESGRIVGLANHTVLIAKDGTEYQIADSASPVRDADGTVVGVVLIFRDVTEAYNRERKLQESERRLRQIFDNVPVGIFRSNLRGKPIEINGEMARMLGFSSIEEVFEQYTDLGRDLYADPAKRQEFVSRIQERGEVYNFEYQGRKKDGESVWLSMNARLTSASAGEQQYIDGFTQDITRRKLTDSALQRSLEERETLIRELYHRTKNNMQVIVSLLSMKKRQVPDEQVREILTEMETKISAMSLVHQKLYRSRSLSSIALNEYLAELVSMIADMYGGRAAMLKLQFDLEPLSVVIDTAIPLGLVVNELTTNAIKYAFPEGRAGTIRLEMRKSDDEQIELIFQDDGIGIPDSLDVENSTTLGLELIKTIVQDQLEGSVAFERGGGTACRISIPADSGRERL